jgi:hypothetical protein
MLWDRERVLISTATQRVSVDRPGDCTFVFRNVRTNLGATLSGSVLIDGQPPDSNATIPNVTVAASRPPRLGGYDYAEPQVANLRGTDRFELTGLRGPTILRAQGGRGVAVSIRRAGEDIAGKALDLLGTETIDDVVIEFTTKVASVEVAIIGTRDPDELDLAAAPVLEALRKQATPVTLIVGQTAKVALRVTSLPR